MPDHDKRIHCQGKRRKRHPASNVAAESAPHPRHAVKACANDRTIPNNMVLWQRLAACSFVPGGAMRPSISNRSPGSCRSVGLARALLFVKAAPVLAKKRSLQQSHFRAVNTLAFWTPTSGPLQLRWKLAAQIKPNFDPLASCQELRVSSSSQGSTLPKMGLPRATAFRFGQGHCEAISNPYFKILKQARPKTGAPNPHVGACGNPVFGVATWCSERSQLLQKFIRNNKTTKCRKKDTNIHVLNWGGPPLGDQILYTFPTPKTGIKQIEQFNDIILRILRSRLESKLELFQLFPHCKWGFSRCTDSARLRQDSATKDIKTGTKLW